VLVAEIDGIIWFNLSSCGLVWSCAEQAVTKGAQLVSQGNLDFTRFSVPYANMPLKRPPGFDVAQHRFG